MSGPVNMRSIWHFFPGESRHHVIGMIDVFEKYKRELCGENVNFKYVLYVGDTNHGEREKEYEDYFAGKPDIAYSVVALAAMRTTIRRIASQDVILFHSTLFPVNRLYLTGTFLRRRIVFIHWVTYYRRKGLRGSLADKVFGAVMRQAVFNVFLVRKDKLLQESQFGIKNGLVLSYFSETLQGEELDYSQRPLKVIVGNCGTESNRHLHVLRALAKFSKEDLLIYCPLSYRFENAYRDEVIALGRQLFGTKFVPITEMLSRPDYLALLDSCHIAILDMQEQQALFQLYTMLSFGRKVYLMADGFNHDLVQSIGITTPTTDLLRNEEYAAFSAFDRETARKQQQVMKSYLSLDRFVTDWAELIARSLRPG